VTIIGSQARMGGLRPNQVHGRRWLRTARRHGNAPRLRAATPAPFSGSFLENALSEQGRGHLK